MKRTVKIYLGILLGLVLSACTQLDEAIQPDDGENVEVTFRLGMSENVSLTDTRALTADGENHVSVIHVLMFKGTNYWGYTTVNSGIGQGNSANGYTKTFTAKVERSASPSDTYSFVFLANVDVNLSSYNTNGTVTKATILDALTVAETKIDNRAATTTTNYIPMWGESAAIQVIAGSTNNVNVKLLRMAAAIDILSPTEAITEVYLYNRYANGRVVPTSVTNNKVSTPTPAGSRTTGASANYCSGSATTSFTNRLYAFESDYNASNPHCVIVKLGSKGYYRLNFVSGTTDLSILRNHHYTFTITGVNGDGASTHALAYSQNQKNVEVTVTTANSLDGETTVSSRGYYLTVSRNYFAFPAAALTNPSDEDSKLLVKTTYTGGWNVNANASNNFYLVNGAAGTTITSGSGSAAGITTTTYIARKANSGSARDATLTFTAGVLSVTVDVHQVPPIPTNPTNNTNPQEVYVGAFWKKTERAERQITMPSSSAPYYSVEILDYGDFAPGEILLAEGHPNWGDEANPETRGSGYFVEDGKTYLIGLIPPSGFKFRIGLGNKYPQASSTKPARYARLLVRTGYHYEVHRILWLRQGEDPDYLFRTTGDGSGNGSLTSRPLAKKVSAYNLTAEAYKTNNGAQSVKINTRGGVFVDYPTQAGAYFRWANPLGIYAYHPTNPSSGMPSNWNSDMNLDIFTNWDTLSATNESCPIVNGVQYRRPSDGSIAGQAFPISPLISEVSQTFFYSPHDDDQASYDNLVRGFYADGYFDRRELKTQEQFHTQSGIGKYCVAPNTSLVAYVGALVYNPNNNAHVFLPFGGKRWDTGLWLAGYDVELWTSTNYLGQANSYGIYQANHQRFKQNIETSALLTRCIVE